MPLEKPGEDFRVPFTKSFRVILMSWFEYTWPFLVITGVYILVFSLISPRYEVPQNDDWAYYLTVQQWFQTGKLSHLGWNDPTLLFQLIWGGLFSWLFGVSYTSLRLSTLVLSWLGVVSLYGILRRLTQGRAVSLLGAGVLLLNPVYLCLSYSYNTDIPYVGLATAATLSLLWAFYKNSTVGFLACGVLTACAFLVRQQGIILPLVGSAYLLFEQWHRYGAYPRRSRTLIAILCLWLPVLLALGLHAHWLQSATDGTWSPRWSNLHPFFSAPSVGGFVDLLVQSLHATVGLLLSFGILLIPLFVALWPTGKAPLRRRRVLQWVLYGSILLFAILSAVLAQQQEIGMRGWPYGGNYLGRFGPLEPIEGGSRWLPLGVTFVATLIAPVCSALVVVACLRVFLEWNGDPVKRKQVLVLALGMAQLLPVFALKTAYDRYFLVALPAVVAAVICWSPVRRGGLIAGFICLCLLGGVSLEWTRATIDRSRARWEVAQELVDQGVPPAQIAGVGFEWGGHHLYLKALNTLKIHPPFDLDSGWPWDTLVNPHYCIREGIKVPEHPLALRSYRPFFGQVWYQVFAIPSREAQQQP